MKESRKLGLAGRIVLGAGALVGSILNSGCSDYGNMVARDLARTGLTQVAVSGVRNEVEGPRGTTVNVGDFPANYKPQDVVALKRRGILMRRWKDINENKLDDSGELFGEIGDSINMTNMGLNIIVDYHSVAGTPITYTLLDSNDNILVTRCLIKRTWLLHPNKLSEGKYTVVAQYGNTTRSREFTVIR